MVSADKARHSVHFVPEEKHLFCWSRYKDIPVRKTCMQLLIPGGGMLRKNCAQVNALRGVPLSATVKNIFYWQVIFLSCIQKWHRRGCPPPRPVKTAEQEGGSTTEALFTTHEQTYMADNESCWWFFRFLFVVLSLVISVWAQRGLATPSEKPPPFQEPICFP